MKKLILIITLVFSATVMPTAAFASAPPQFPTYLSNALLGWTEGLAVNTSGDLFVANYGDNSVFKYTKSGVLTKVASMPAGGTAKGLAIDTFGNLYMVDQDHGKIYKESATTLSSGINATEANSGLITVATGVGRGGGLAFDASGNLFYAQDASILAIRASSLSNPGSFPLTTSSGVITIAGSTSLSSRGSADVAFDNNGNLFVAQGSVVTEISASVVASALAGSIVPVSSVKVIMDSATSGLTGGAVGVKTDSSGDLIVSDDGSADRVVLVKSADVIAAFSSGTVIASSKLSVITLQFGNVEQMSGMAYSPQTGILYVGDGGNSKVFASIINSPTDQSTVVLTPDSPTNLSVSTPRNGGILTLSWSPVADNGSGAVTSYICSAGAATTITVSSASCTFTNSTISILNNQASLSVVAVNASGTSPPATLPVQWASAPTTTSPTFTTTTTTLPPVSKTITCVKGKTIKKVTGASPVCPTGYTKK